MKTNSGSYTGSSYNLYSFKSKGLSDRLIMSIGFPAARICKTSNPIETQICGERSPMTIGHEEQHQRLPYCSGKQLDLRHLSSHRRRRSLSRRRRQLD